MRTNISSPKKLQRPDQFDGFVPKWSSYAQAVQTIDHRIQNQQIFRSLNNGGIFHSKDLGEEYSSTTSIKVKVMKIEHRGAVITYRVLLGPFAVSILMLNVDARATSLSKRILYSGHTVTIFEISTQNGGSYVCKRLSFNRDENVLSMAADGINWAVPGNFSDLENFLYQLAFAKLCDGFKIGPKMGAPHHRFDLICYHNAMEFYMERCVPFHEKFSSFTVNQIWARLLYCMRVMHRYHLIHKDIKPENILFSPSRADFVLMDFGISEIIAELQNERTLTFREGTLAYMSRDMKRLPRGGQGYVNLYENDLYCLEATMHSVKNITPRNQRNTTMNQVYLANAAEKNEEEEAIAMASDICSNNFESNHRGSNNKVFQKLFKPYFQCSLKDSGNQSQPNLEFLIRSTGLGCALEEQLEIDFQDTTDVKAKLLRAKLGQLLFREHPSLVDYRTTSSTQRLINRILRIVDLIDNDEQKDMEDNRKICQLMLLLLPSEFKIEAYNEAEWILKRVRNYVLPQFEKEFAKWSQLINLVHQRHRLTAIQTILSLSAQEQRVKFFVDAISYLAIENNDPVAMSRVLRLVLPPEMQVVSDEEPELCTMLFEKLLAHIDAHQQPLIWEVLSQFYLSFLNNSSLFHKIVALEKNYKDKVPIICKILLAKHSFEAKLFFQSQVGNLTEIVQLEERAKEIYGINSLRYNNLLQLRSKLYYLRGEYQKAKDLALTVLRKNQLFGEDNCHIGDLCLQIAFCLLRSGQIEQARDYATKAVRNAKKNGLKKYQSYKILYERALFDYEYSEIADTKEAYLEAKRVIEQHLSRGKPIIDYFHRYFISFYCLLAKIHLKFDQKEEAVRLLEKSIEVPCKDFQMKLTHTCSLYSLCNLYLLLDKIEQATNILLRFQSNYCKDTESDETLQLYCFSSIVWMKLGRIHKAQSWIKTTSKILRQKPHIKTKLFIQRFGEAAIECVAKGYYDLANAFIGIFREDDVHNYYAALLSVKSTNFRTAINQLTLFINSVQSEQNQLVADSYRHLAKAHKKLGESAKAQQAQAKSASIYRFLVEAGNDKQTNLDQLGLCLMDAGRLTQALRELFRAAIITRKKGSRNYLPAVHAAECLYRMGAYNKMSSILFSLPNKRQACLKSKKLLSFILCSHLYAKKTKRFFAVVASIASSHKHLISEIMPQLKAFLKKTTSTESQFILTLLKIQCGLTEKVLNNIPVEVDNYNSNAKVRNTLQECISRKKIRRASLYSLSSLLQQKS